MATPAHSAHTARRPAAAATDTDAARDARYENPFAPPDEDDAAEGPRPARCSARFSTGCSRRSCCCGR